MPRYVEKSGDGQCYLFSTVVTGPICAPTDVTTLTGRLEFQPERQFLGTAP